MRTLKKTLCLVLALVLCFGLVGTAFAGNFDKYTDAETVGAAYKEAVDVMMGAGIIEGMNATELAPQGAYTREQAAKIIAFMKLGKTAAEALNTAAAPFADVAAGRWSAGYIAYCAQEGIIKGYGDGKFGPEDKLTGYQWGAMLLRAVGYGVNGEYEGASWSIAVAKDAIPLGIFAGDLAGAVNEDITREQAILYAFNTFTGVAKASYSTLLGTYINDSTTFGTALTATTLASSVYGLSSMIGRVDYDALTGTTAKVYKIGNVAVEADADDVNLPYKVWTIKGKAVSDIYPQYKVLGTSNAGLAWGLITTATLPTFVAEVDTTAANTAWATGFAPTYYMDNTSAAYWTGDPATPAPGNPAVGTKVTFIDVLDEVAPNARVYAFDGKAEIVLIQTETVAVVSAAAYTTGVGALTKVYIPGVLPNTGVSAASVVAPDGLKKGDVVTVQLKADGKYYVALAETVTGSLTKITNGAMGYTYTIGEDTYMPGANMAVNGVPGYNTVAQSSNNDLNKPGTYYKGTEGFIVGFKPDTTPLYDLALVIGTDYEGSFGAYTYQARLLFADNTTKDVNVTAVGTAPENRLNTITTDISTEINKLPADGTIVQYTESPYGWTLITKGGAASNNMTYKNKGTTLADSTGRNATGYIVDGKTIAFVKTTPLVGAPVYTAYVGAANIPTLTADTPYIYTNNTTSSNGEGLTYAMYFDGGLDTSTTTVYYGIAADTSVSGVIPTTTVSVFGKDGTTTAYELAAGSSTVAKGNVIRYTIGTDGKISATAVTASNDITIVGSENYINDGSKILPQAADIAAVYVPLVGTPYVGTVAATTNINGVAYGWKACVAYNVVAGVPVSVAQIIYVEQPAS